MKKKNVNVSGVKAPDSDPGALGETRPTTALPVAERKMVAHGLVRPDPDQPRKQFEQGKLEELAESIRQQGILQDLVLEFVPATCRLLEPDLTNKSWRVEQFVNGSWDLRCEDTEAEVKRFWDELEPEDREASYQIVCGERRWRAAGVVGLTELPARVYTGLTAQQRFAMQMIENNQRENVSALEEAAAVKRQLEDRRRDDPAFSPEKLAVELGMSRAAIYERLKLNRLQPKIREALVAGAISTSIAAEVAKLPTPKLQEQLLKTLEERAKYQPMSVRDVQKEIDEEYVKQLKDAPFDTKGDLWSGLDPAEIRNLPEGICFGSCVECRQRTGNMVAEFPDLAKSPNVCTNPDCYGEKCKRHWLMAAKDLAQQGATVLTEKEYRKQKSQYVQADDRCNLFADQYWEAAKDVLKKHAPTEAYVATEDGLKPIYKVEDLAGAAAKAKVKLADPKKEKEKGKKQEALRKRREAWLETQWAELAKALPKVKEAEAWRIVELLRGHLEGYEDSKHQKILAGKAEDGRAFVLALLFSDGSAEPLDYCCEWDEDVVDAWKTAGVDLVAAFKEHEASAQKEMPLAKAEPKQKELLHTGKFKLSPASRARIIAAQKARWAKIKAAK